MLKRSSVTFVTPMTNAALKCIKSEDNSMEVNLLAPSEETLSPVKNVEETQPMSTLTTGRGSTSAGLMQEEDGNLVFI